LARGWSTKIWSDGTLQQNLWDTSGLAIAMAIASGLFVPSTRFSCQQHIEIPSEHPSLSQIDGGPYCGSIYTPGKTSPPLLISLELPHILTREYTRHAIQRWQNIKSVQADCSVKNCANTSSERWRCQVYSDRPLTPACTALLLLAATGIPDSTSAFVF
jgi:hypothetical protein